MRSRLLASRQVTTSARRAVAAYQAVAVPLALHCQAFVRF